MYTPISRFLPAVLATLFLTITLFRIDLAAAHVCWFYTGQPSTNPQPWVTGNPSVGCTSSNALHMSGSTVGQVIGEEHRNWHCGNPVPSTLAPAATRNGYGRAFLAFHRQFILDFDNYRIANGYPRLEVWDPFQNAVVPGNQENSSTPFTHCSSPVSFSTPGTCSINENSCTSNAQCAGGGDVCVNERPAGAVCTNCSNLPSMFVGANLDNFNNLGEVGYELELNWHGTYHNGVRVLGCGDVGGFLYTSRDPAFWMAHKKLDEVSRDWQSLQATDVVIVLDRSGSMDDNCSSTTPPPGETPCAINDARESATTFANLVLDVRMDGGVPASEQHRIGLVSFASTATTELALTSANGIVTDDGINNTPFETQLAGISTGGNTSIAAGIRQAISILNAVSDPSDHQAILVLTDGKENTPPCLEGTSGLCISGDVLTQSEVGNIQIVAVGFGAGAEETNLRNVAERHGGIFVAEANVANTLSLQKFFVTAYGEIFDAGTSVDPDGTIQTGQVASTPFEIEICDDNRLSVAMGRQDVGRLCDLELELYTPSGDKVDRNAAGVEAGHGPRHDFIHVDLPYRNEAKGTWRGRVVRTADSIRDCKPQAYFYSALVKGLGRIDPFVAMPNIVVGQPLLATFRITESNRPVGGFDKVNAKVIVERADGGVETLALFDDETHGDNLANNHIWSAKVPKPPTKPGVYHLRGNFELTEGSCTRVREAEYSIVVTPEPEECTTAVAGGPLNFYTQNRVQPGAVIDVDDLVCLRNRCARDDQYEVSISDRLNWLKTVDPATGALVDLPRVFRSGSVEGFDELCFGRGPKQGNPAGGLPLVAVIPKDAVPGQSSPVSVLINSLANPRQKPASVNTAIVVTPPPDCNENKNDDFLDIASGSSKDEDVNGVPDECDVGGHFHPPGPDEDGDDVPDTIDNCTKVVNNEQRDSDNDGYGNFCDPDFDNSLNVDFADLAYMKSMFFTPDADADLNGDGTVDFADLAIQKAMFFQPPGPSGLAP